MQKDVIYIDVEDDITAIIGKVKGSKEKIVALVPPKRIGVLQSAVNLRLLKRTADHSNKHLVLITNNQALLGLASSAAIPVAKNLQSKPEIPEIAALSVDDDDDIIDGGQLPIGEHVASASAKPPVPDAAVENLSIDEDTPTVVRAAPPAEGEKPSRPRAKSGTKVPSFSSFRKKIFIFGGIGVALIAFLVWAIWFAPQATIIIDAKTSDKEVNSTVTLGADVTSDAKEGTLKSVTQQEKQTQTVDFDATGTKDVGEKATGVVRFSTDSYSALIQGITIPAGTSLTSTSGKAFVTDKTVQLSLSAGNSDSTGVTAAESGESYNGATGDVNGAPSGVSARFSDATTGGTTKTVKIVLQADVLKAKQQLATDKTDEVRATLAAKFTDGFAVIDSSFTTVGGDAVSAPAIGEEASTGKAKLTQEATYSMTGVSKDELNGYLKVALENTVTNKDEQRVYETGVSSVKFSDFKQGERTSTAVLDAVGQIGPKINDDQIKKDSKGKRYGEVQADLKGIDGVSDADVKFSPFWVNTVPDDESKIKIEFKLQNGSQE